MFKIANVALTVLGVAILFVVATVFAVFGTHRREQEPKERERTDGKPA